MRSANRLIYQVLIYCLLMDIDMLLYPLDFKLSKGTIGGLLSDVFNRRQVLVGESRLLTSCPRKMCLVSASFPHLLPAFWEAEGTIRLILPCHFAYISWT